MYLTSSTLVPYLIDRSVLTPAEIVGDDFTILDAGRRNRNFKISRRDGSGIFIKQVPVMAVETTQSLQREATLYALADKDVSADRLKPLMPRLRHYDRSRHLLAVDLVPNSQSLTFYQMQVAAVPGAMEDIAAQIGTLLALCHSQSPDLLAETTKQGIFPAALPWILNFPEAGEKIIPTMSGGARAILATLRQEPSLAANFSRLREEWARTSLIHGDLKWENFLVSQKDGPDGTAKVQLIDWELADLGDAAWDVACVLASFIQPIIVGRFSAQGQHMGPATADDIMRAQACCRAFWRTYTAAFTLTPEQQMLAMERCVRFAAVRFVLTAYEIAQSIAEMPPSAQLAIRTAADILNDPRSAVRQLFALDTGA